MRAGLRAGIGAAAVSYVEQIEAALGVGLPEKTRVNLTPCDMGRKIAVAAGWPDGRRWGVRVDFKDGWVDLAIAALRDWRDSDGRAAS